MIFFPFFFEVADDKEIRSFNTNTPKKPIWFQESKKGKILHPIENISRDLAIIGNGSLTIEIPNAGGDAVGLSAAALIVGADLTVKTPDCENSSVGIVCGF